MNQDLDRSSKMACKSNYHEPVGFRIRFLWASGGQANNQSMNGIENHSVPIESFREQD